MAAIANDWLEPLKPEFSKPYYKKLYQTVNEEYRTHQIFPPADDIFNAFALTPLHEVKVVILGTLLLGKTGCRDPTVTGQYL